MPQTEEKKETSLNNNEQPKYTFAGGTNPNYNLDVDDDTFYNQFNEDLKSDQPVMGNFWTKDGKLTKTVEAYDKSEDYADSIAENWVLEIL